MMWLDYGPDSSIEEMMASHKKYREYLISIKDKIPESAFEFASAEWHYNAADHRCPHDAQFRAFEMKQQVRADSETVTNIEMRFRGAYEDRDIHIRYENVGFYSLEKSSLIGIPAKVFTQPTSDPGDWLLDEIYLSDDGLIIHEIEFAWNTNWRIHCENLEYRWSGESESVPPAVAGG